MRRFTDSGWTSWWRVAVVAVLALSGCDALVSSPSTRVVTPTLPVSTPTATPVPPSPTAAASPTPSPTATPTPWPTIDPAMPQATASAGLAVFDAEAGRLVCLRYEDTNADGEPEWIALLHQESAGSGRLSALIFDGVTTYRLVPVPPKPGFPEVGLGQYPTCEVVVRDVNLDGVPEIAIFGHAMDNETLMHLFAWDGEGYRRLGFFAGDGGVKFVERDGDLAEEIWEGFRVQAAPSLVWYIVYTWRDGSYGWTSEHHDWYFTDRPQSYPTHAPEYAVIAFYLALNDRDLPGAYGLLWPEGRLPYEEWALGYATTLQVSVGATHRIPGASEGERAQVAAMVTSWDNEGGVIIGRLWNTEWETVRTDAGWRLLSSTAELLEEWTVFYWP